MDPSSEFPEHKQLKVGDLVSFPGSDLERPLLGFILEKNPYHTAGEEVQRNPAIDPFYERAKVADARGSDLIGIESLLGNEVVKPTANQSTNHPYAKCRLWKLDPSWDCRFQQVLKAPVHPWSGMAEALLATIHDKGWFAGIVGGVVRSILLGADPTDPLEINDLDLVGTMPAGVFRRMCFEHQMAECGGEGWRRNSFWYLETSPNQVVHVKQVSGYGNRAALEIEPSIQYAALKIQREVTDGEKEERWLFGSSYYCDSQWRDIRYNTLIYDPSEGLIVDPTGQGLYDLGLNPEDLKRPFSEVKWRPRRVWPIDLPTNASTQFLAKNALVRVVKQAIDLHAQVRQASVDDGHSQVDWSYVPEWFEKLATTVDRRITTNKSGTAILRNALIQLVEHSKQKGRSIPTLEDCGVMLGSAFRDLLRDVGFPFEDGRYEPTVKLQGTRLVPLRADGTLDLENMDWTTKEGTLSAARTELERVVSGYHHVGRPVVFRGEERQALCLESEDGPTLVTLTGWEPKWVTDDELTAIQKEDPARDPGATHGLRPPSIGRHWLQFQDHDDCTRIVVGRAALEEVSCESTAPASSDPPRTLAMDTTGRSLVAAIADSQLRIFVDDGNGWVRRRSVDLAKGLGTGIVEPSVLAVRMLGRSVAVLLSSSEATLVVELWGSAPSLQQVHPEPSSAAVAAPGATGTNDAFWTLDPKRRPRESSLRDIIGADRVSDFVAARVMGSSAVATLSEDGSRGQVSLLRSRANYPFEVEGSPAQRIHLVSSRRKPTILLERSGRLQTLQLDGLNDK